MKIILKLLITLIFFTSVTALTLFADEIEQIDKKELNLLLLDAELSDKLGENEEAKAIYNKLLSRYNLILDNPNSTKKERIDALGQIAAIKTKQNEFEDVIRLCNELRDEYPDDSVISIIEAETRQFYAAFYTSQMLPDLSIMEFEAILDLNNLPEQWYAFAKDYIAHLYLSKQDPEQALYWYSRIIEDHPNLKNWPASAHFSIARCYLRQDEIEKAKKELRTIITEHPESSWANPAKKKLRSLE